MAVLLPWLIDVVKLCVCDSEIESVREIVCYNKKGGERERDQTLAVVFKKNTFTSSVSKSGDCGELEAAETG